MSTPNTNIDTTDTSPEAIQAWAQGHLAGLLATKPESLDPTADFDSLGVDSALAVALLMDIEDRYGVDLPPESLFENPTLAAVVEAVRVQLPSSTPS